MNLSIDRNGWFCFYKGFVYANRPTRIHDRINNKELIDRIRGGNTATGRLAPVCVKGVQP